MSKLEFNMYNTIQNNKYQTYMRLSEVDSLPVMSNPSLWQAVLRIVIISGALSFSRTNTLHRLSKAELRLKEGFSVVAPIRTIQPFSTCGRNISCKKNEK